MWAIKIGLSKYKFFKIYFYAYFYTYIVYKIDRIYVLI